MTVTSDTTGCVEDNFSLLDKFSSFANEDQQRWWKRTGPVLSRLLSDANYPQKDHIPYLYFLQHQLVPYLGVFPTPGQDSQRYMSNLTAYGVPFEFSWNLLHQIIRISFEPISGTTSDPLNKKGPVECLSRLASLDKTIDLTRFDHFQRDLILTSDEEARLRKSSSLPRSGRGQCNLAVELIDGGISAKAYFYPGIKSMATGISPAKLMFDSIRKLGVQSLDQSIRCLSEYLGMEDENGGTPADKAFTPILIGCDLCDPQESRIKFYISDQMVTWERVADIWTLGGRRSNDPHCAEGLKVLRTLWDLLEIPEGYRSEVWPDVVFGRPPRGDHRSIMMANWTLSSDRLPDPQVYLFTFGMNDNVVMEKLVTFYEMVGWADLARTYKAKVASYYPGLDLSQTNYVHTLVSFSYRNAKPYLSVYYSPF
ncbi:12-alpha,13-alpha-dihydroxyfumitremorgin C prenyltransferase [Aspergillus floccosus]